MTDPSHQQSLRHRKAPITQDQVLEAAESLGKQKQYPQPQVGSSPNGKQGKSTGARRPPDFLDEIVDVTCFRYDARTVWTTTSLFLLSLVSRLWNIHKGAFVVWDEAHFGKFASHYLKREFYFDVHPPLGKMLVGFAGALAGYRGDFEFKSGEKYPDTLNYTVMRMFLAMFGVVMVPVAYLTCLELGMRKRTALLAALMVLCDNAFLSISRYILLDSMLLCFTVTTVYCWAVFRNTINRPFSPEWWFWMFMTGFNIGLVSSVKWVGFFVTAMVGFSTIEDLWTLFGNLRLTKVQLAAHFFARVLGLIVIPIMVYVASFWMHFAILHNSGPGDAQMSSLFQAQLRGNNFHENPLYMAYGSRVTLKNNGYAGGLLHSHVQTYPHGSKQQQVTCYHHKDSNNNWSIRFAHNATEEMQSGNGTLLIKNGDIIRLVHTETGRNLHSHPLAAPVTKTGWEVSGYGNETVGDDNDHWKVEIVDDLHESNPAMVRSLSTRFRLRHIRLNCLLRSHNVILPQWGFKQAEVYCDKYNTDDKHNIWNIEQHWNENLQPGSAESYKTNFFHDFIHLNVAMYTSNNALVPDPEKEPDHLTSSPHQWPLATVGLRMCGWGDKDFKVFLMGNPVLWWLGAASLVGFCALWFFYILRFRRGFQDWTPSAWYHFEYVGKWMIIGWVLHFIPFMIMGRVTYLHHYFPALYFAILCSAFLTEQIGNHLPSLLSRVLTLLVGIAVVASFAYFAPLSYGFEEPSSEYKNRQWLSTWRMTD